MYNFFEGIRNNPKYFRQFDCGDALITKYTCPVATKCIDVWSQLNYIAYVIDGRKIWHTANGSYDLHKGTCLFVRKGASIVEQFFEPDFCTIMFFVSDEFIYNVLKNKFQLTKTSSRMFDPVISIKKDEQLEAFFHSMMTYFTSSKTPDKNLLELKFKELILSVADNPLNADIISFFHSLVNEPQTVSLKRVMNDNYCFNLKLEEFAQLSNRSLSAFKRDFQKLYKTTPGKWLTEQRLLHAKNLLSNAGKSISEAAFESGFENPSHFSRSFKERFGVAPTAIKHLKVA
jgi:AraC-like DNA-binding protein